MAKLFQLKEWRFDRLREHVRAEGWTRSLFGFLRPGIFFLAITAEIVTPVPFRPLISEIAMGVFALLTLLQLLSKRQPFPVPTAKAALIVLLSIVYAALLAAVLEASRPAFLLGMPVIQPFIVGLSVLTLFPLDFFLKRSAMNAAMKIRSAHPEILTIGITGSVGKTTTKELLRHLLAPLGAIATPAYVNSEMGVARWLIKVLAPKKDSGRTPEVLRPKSEVLIVEMGAYRTGEIKKLCDIAQPSLGVITAVGTQHVALFGSENAIEQAKGELFEALPRTGHAFVNIDSDAARRTIGRAACAVTTVGVHSEAILRGQSVHDTDTGLSLTVTGRTFTLPLRGLHNATNVLLAIAVARHLGMNDEDIQSRLRTFQPLPHTFSVRFERGVLLLDDTHNSSPSSFRAGLEWSALQPQRPRILLTSGILELGPGEKQILEDLGRKASDCAERVIFTGERGRDFFAGGYGKRVEMLSQSTPPVPTGGILLCIGRMPLSSIQQLLPNP
ncbi:UDP-N-acetylmuramoyl-tripeptide--D-alanyl-D-alanine ligase [Candidatus Peregrinibacteria bacterium]|nr:UDP-N-acetylmuramoyl-tripeptide--D-alanyl-D-alanine ligase [Candidatus Peregrinibacteria bacterium]